MSTLPDRMLTMEQAAEYLNVKYDWLQRQVAAGRVPHTKFGRQVRFAPLHIEQIVRHGVQSPPPRPRPEGRGRRSTL